MTQKRLNHVMVCHIRRDVLMQLNCREIADTFINNKNDNSKLIFGEL